MEALATAGTILGIIDVCARCISSLSSIRTRYKEADLLIELLSGQLTTVKAALRQIHCFIQESVAGSEQHYQLTLDLGVAVHCCNLLIRFIEDQVVQLDYNEADELEFRSKVHLLLESKGIDECLSRLDRQINALNLIISVFNSTSGAEQQKLLIKRSARDVMDNIKDDTTSLIVLCDRDSFDTKRTQTTTTTSKFSMNFTFDAELLKSHAYKSTLRSLMRKSQERTIRSSKTFQSKGMRRQAVQLGWEDQDRYLISIGEELELYDPFTGTRNDKDNDH